MAYTRKTSDIITSNDLDYVLEQIKDNSEVARLLLKQRHSVENLVDNHINYISISGSDKTKISYLTTERIDSLLSNGEDLWTSSKRFHIKPGAFVSKLFKNIHPKEVENFSQLFRNVQTKITSNFRVVNGNNILHYYHHGSYLSESGSLGNSCMKYDACQDYLELYTENKDKISMLVLVADNHGLIGRALLWTIGDMKIMDRIYTIDDETYQFHFKKWADDNGYWYKKEQRWNNSLFFESKGKTIYKEISCELNSFKFNNYPYMDTFKFVDDEGNLYNYQPGGNFYTLSTTDGGRQSDNHLRFDGIDRVYRYSHETVYLDYLGLYTHQPKCFYSESNDCYILRKDAVMCEESRDYIFGDEWNHLNNVEQIKARIKRYSDRPSREKERLFEFILSQRQRIMSDFIETNTEEL